MRSWTVPSGRNVLFIRLMPFTAIAWSAGGGSAVRASAARCLSVLWRSVVYPSDGQVWVEGVPFGGESDFCQRLVHIGLQQSESVKVALQRQARARARGWRWGNAPGALSVRLKGACKAATAVMASATCGTRAASMSPRNLSVRCTPSGRTSRRLSICRWRSSSMAAVMCRFTSSSSSMATKVRMVSFPLALKCHPL